ncbi:unnamed protein product [Phytophthora fragariaefolia]|uniref:Unnamed protein product n=1 Tax=Phytophthora fragariaefolia TaxID=1490495 RepID=A0A9W6XT04_9STRA|nr:unnamed protein product [Phytophthora fragariaefolia]
MMASAGSTARDPLTRAPSADPSNASPVSPNHVALPPLDRDAVRASISHLTGEVEDVKKKLDLAQGAQAEEAAWFLARIDELQAQLASAHSASTSPSAQGLRAATLEVELDKVSTDRNEAWLQAVESDDAARAWEASSVCAPSVGSLLSHASIELGTPDSPEEGDSSAAASAHTARGQEEDGDGATGADDDDGDSEISLMLPRLDSRLRRSVSLCGSGRRPWALPESLQLSVRELTVKLLCQKFSKPAYWILPPDEKAPSTQFWPPDLRTEANVRMMYDAVPWGTLDAVVAPVSFDLVAWVKATSRQYAQFDEDYRQALWESTHSRTCVRPARISTSW